MVDLISGWWKTIAHPDFADWATVIAYCATSFLTMRAAQRAGARSSSGDRTFWRFATGLLLLLAVNELLDLQTLVTVFGRAHAQASGWYEGRRAIQYLFVAALGGCGVVAGAMALWLTRNRHWPIRLALAGFLSIALFIVARASSIHHVDDILGRGPAVFPLGSMQEITGIALVAFAARFYALRQGRPADDRFRDQFGTS